ncbi:MAG: hypothetical protein AABY14_00670, partial [Nanoarchaeota archaeon]
MKNKQKLKIVIVVILMSILLLAISIIFLKVNYLLGSGLVLYLTPTSKSISLSYGESQELEFNASVNNPFYCVAECNYTFTDISNSIEIDKGNFTLNPKSILSNKYDITINRIGSGQDIYNFQVTCKNRRTYFCLSQETDYKISPSFIIVNYNLSKELFRLKENMRS